MVLRKFSEIINNKPIFRQCNIFCKYKYFYFQSTFWSLFNNRQKTKSNQEQCSLCCSSRCFNVFMCTHYEPLQCYSTYSRKLKETGVLRSVFPDYIISCDYCCGHIRYFLACSNYFWVLLDVTVCAYLKTCIVSNHIC